MKTEVRKILDSTMQELESSLTSLTQEKLNTIPYEGGWTVAQVGDHLLRSYGVVNVLKGEGKTTHRDPAEKIPSIKQEFLYNTAKNKAPEGIQPSSEIISKEKLLEDLRQKIKDFHEVIDQMDLTMIATGYVIPDFGHFTRLEWIYFTIYHTQRHLQQIKRIIASKIELRQA